MEAHTSSIKAFSPSATEVQIPQNLQVGADWYRDLVDHSQDLLCIHDLQGRLLSVNPAPARVLGYSIEEILQVPMRELIVPEFRPQFDAYLDEIARKGEAHGYMAVLTRFGERRIWQYQNTLRTEGVSSPVVRGMAHDVTEQKQAERALRASESRLRAIFEKSPVGICLVESRTGRFVKLNPKFCEIVGRAEDDLLDRELHQIFHSGDLSATVAEMGQPANGNCCPMESESRLLHPDGSVRLVKVLVVPLADEREASYMAIVQDITGNRLAEIALRQSEARLRVAQEKLTEENYYLEHEINTELGFDEIIGKSDGLKRVLEQVVKVASSDSTVLLLGESGTGKELIARAVHRMSKRSQHPFIKMNCAAIPSGLLESELFGHERGAFTGALIKKIGRLELADKGTLFLDEIGDIPQELQPKLLRVLQDQEFERLGGTDTLKVNFRLIAATNRDLVREVQEKHFRNDLYYRLSVFPVRIPPLRSRRGDIPLLAEHFVRKHAQRMNKSIRHIPKKVLDALIRWNWPGNVRELENFMERSVILSFGHALAAPISELATEDAVVKKTLETVEREHILSVLEESRGQLSGPNGAAIRLGLPRTTLQSKLKQMGVDVRKYRVG